jgi:hypothetical protein
MPEAASPFETHAALRFIVFTMKWPLLRVTRDRLVVPVARLPVLRLKRNDVESLVFSARGAALVHRLHERRTQGSETKDPLLLLPCKYGRRVRGNS